MSAVFVADPLAHQVIGCAIAVHRALGPGRFESVYERCLGSEFDANGVRYVRQVPLPVTYRNQVLPCVFHIDLVVEGRLLVELKAVDRIVPIHSSQMLTYLKLSGHRQGLLINFNVSKLVDGVRSFLN